MSILLSRLSARTREVLRGAGTLVLIAAPGLAARPAQDGAEAARVVAETERAFARMASDSGIVPAFVEYLAPDAVLFRPRAVNGQAFMRAQPRTSAVLRWAPSWAEAAAAGDVGFTTGPWEARRSPSDSSAAFGSFVSVWRRQPNGSYRNVVDVGVPHPGGTPVASATTEYGPTHRAGPAAVDTAAARAALLAADRELGAALRGAPWARVADAWLTADARLLRQGMPPRTGRDAARGMADSLATRRSTPTVVSVAASGDLGYSYGDAWSPRAGEGSESPSDGQYVRLWRRDGDGRWRVLLDVVSQVR